MSADKEEIKDRSDIVEIIGSYVPLKRRGRNYVGLCPFHQEKTPSFNVDPTTRSFTCFGCGAKGDVFTFVEKYENMTFVEAAEHLARRAGLNFERKGGSGDKTPASERDQLYTLNKLACDYFHQRLKEVQIARDYVYEQRGIAHDMVQTFALGYAPEGWDNLTGYLLRQRQDLRLAEAAGLVRKGQVGDYYDVFRHRIVFPIHDEQNRIVGFGGRAFGEEQPKYLNTGETPIFNKSRLLYGLPFARRKIGTEGRILLMEGYMDVIAAHQAGFSNAVATLGTSLTEEHAKKLARLLPENPTVVLVYDADNAGIKATLRSSEILEKEGVAVRVVSLLQKSGSEEKQDPDSLLKTEGGTALFQRAIDESVGRVEYLIAFARNRRDMTTVEGKLGFLNDLYRILSDVPDAPTRDYYLARHAELHPTARYGLVTAINQMRQELETKRAVRSQKSVPKTEAASVPHDPERLKADTEIQKMALKGMLGGETDFRRAGRLSLQQQRLLREYKRLEYADPPAQAMTAEREVGSLTAEERAEQELIRALLETAWRSRVLQKVTVDDFQSPVCRRFFAYVQTHPERLHLEEDALLQPLEQELEREISQAILMMVQEFHARMANVPITEILIAECAENLRRSGKEQELRRVNDEILRCLQQNTPDRESLVALYEKRSRLTREIKGSPSTASGEPGGVGKE